MQPKRWIRDPIQRFWNDTTVPKTTDEDTCWLWCGSITSNGYGRLGVKGRMVAAHRFGYETYIGPIPKGFELMHSCDVPHCVNFTAHLFPVTHRQNVYDAIIKGRWNPSAVVGEGTGSAKLTNAQVTELKSLKGKLTGRMAARMFGITHPQVYKIWNGKYWRGV